MFHILVSKWKAEALEVRGNDSMLWIKHESAELLIYITQSTCSCLVLHADSCDSAAVVVRMLFNST